MLKGTVALLRFSNTVFYESTFATCFKQSFFKKRLMVKDLFNEGFSIFPMDIIVEAGTP